LTEDAVALGAGGDGVGDRVDVEHDDRATLSAQAATASTGERAALLGIT
jgi:hypothetical protein